MTKSQPKKNMEAATIEAVYWMGVESLSPDNFEALERAIEELHQNRGLSPRTTNRPLRAFHNSLRCLLNIDQDELRKAGLVVNDEDFARFRTDPFRWFIGASDIDVEGIWSIISGQEPCPNCHGFGTLDAPYSGSDPSCPDCDGTGRLE